MELPQPRASCSSPPARADRTGQISAWNFSFFLSVLIVYLFLLPVQPLPSAGRSRCPNPRAPGPWEGLAVPPPTAPPPPEPAGEKSNDSGFRGGEKRGKKRKVEGDTAHPAGITGLGGQGGAPCFSMAGRAHGGVRARRNLQSAVPVGIAGSPVCFLLLPFLLSVTSEPFCWMKLVLEVVAPAGAGRGEPDPAAATGGQQVSPVLITMEVIRASARPGHGRGHSSTSRLWINTSLSRKSINRHVI